MTTLTQEERDVLYDVADVLIPATDTMPALRTADADGEWLDRAVAARADLLPALRQSLHTLSGIHDLAIALRGLHGNDRATFNVLTTFVAGSYYMVPRVRELIGYPGQRRAPAPIDLAANELSDEIFEGALNYDGGYRHAPA
jgi:hypothetical protein